SRTDQFAFCVSLYQALYGEKPFSGKTDEERLEATVLGNLAPAPKKTKVPARIRRVLLRGLAVEREARYASMDDLLLDLTRDTARRRWRAAAVASVVAAAGAAAFFVHKSSQERLARICMGGEEESAEVWNQDVQQGIEGALLATGVPYAADTWQRTR